MCAGTNYGFTRMGGDDGHYEVIKEAFNGCEIVLGDLEITFLLPHHDVSFLKTIQEVGGHVFIAGNKIKSLPLENLRLIRGNLLNPGGYALRIGSNRYDSYRAMEIPLRSLTEILNGGVQIYSSHLCNLHTIQWEDIVNTERFRISVSEIEDTNFDCSSCDVNCNGSCWAPGPENCQRFTKRDCSIMCSHGCRGPTSSDCCDEQCASGCTGSQPKDCLACRTLNDGETCRESCPASTIYNTDKFKTEPNANAMHHIHDYCFRECPDSYKRLETGECVSECSPDSEEIEENGIHVCRKRIGKACDGIGTGVLANAVSIRSTNIDLFQNCTKILGNLIFLPQDKYSEPSALLDPMKYNIFKTIQEITEMHLK
uniref:receptor protein-tyrosine kinase n=1 Tax=Leptobrachium leishanense TaxID=445787 RepID=A0A8C5MBZ6_9ANUR